MTEGPTTSAPSRREWAAVAALLALGAWLRFRHLGDVPFGEDAAHMLALADRLRAGQAVLTGVPSSKGLLNPPLSIYILFLARLFLHSPRAIAAATGVWNLAAVAGTWAIVRRWFGVRVALVATALFTVSGWAVFYSREIWQQDMIPPISVAALGALLAWAVERRRWGLGLALAAAGATSQLHMTGFAWYVVIAAVWLALRPPLSWKSIAAGLGASIALYVPWIVAGLTTGLGRGHGGPQALFVDPFGTAIRHALGSVTHGGITFDLPTMHAAFARMGGVVAALHPVFDLVPWIGAALAIAGFVAIVPRGRAWTDRIRGIPTRIDAPAAPTVLFLWIAVPLAAMVGSGLSTAPHYVILLFPGMWILAALGLEWLSTRTRGAAIAAFGFVFVAEIAFVLALQAWIASDFERPGGYGPALRFQEAAIARIAKDAATSTATLSAVPEPEPGTTTLQDNFPWLLHEAIGARAGAGSRAAQRWVILDLGDGALSPAAQSALEERHAERFGSLWVCRWE